MTIFDPYMPAPTRVLAPRAPSQRIVPPPHVLPSCDRHQTWHIADLDRPGDNPSDCKRCCKVLAIRHDIITRANRRHIVGVARTNRYGK